MFSGNHPLLTQAFGPMTVRFFILQSHYRSTLDFSSEALTASEKAYKRLWEAYETLLKLPVGENAVAADAALDEKINKWLAEFEEFMDDDFSTPKVLANMFEMAPVINSIKDGLIAADAISSQTLSHMKERFTSFLVDIFGLLPADGAANETLQGVMQLLIDIRKEAKQKKDYATSDKIRIQLNELGILLKDEKDGGMSWTVE
jgi:cysteinyl-tRNA synthetase